MQDEQPPVTIRATWRPRPHVLDELADLALELLDEQRRSGGR